MSARVLLALAWTLAVATSGCAMKLREIPARPLSQRSSAVVARDTRQCDQAITGTLKGPWLGGELEFAACMIARNYQTFVQVLDAPLEVRRTSVRGGVSAARILNDLVACERFASEHVTLIEKVGRPLVVVAGLLFWPLGFGATTASPVLAGQRRRDYTACMEPRGYVVTAWKSDPSPMPHTGESP